MVTAVTKKELAQLEKMMECVGIGSIRASQVRIVSMPLLNFARGETHFHQWFTLVKVTVSKTISPILHDGLLLGS